MTLRAGFFVAFLFVAMVMGTTPVQALDLDGVEVQAELIINGLKTNFFDPANHHVPPGFGNSSIPDSGTGEASAFVSDSVVEFGYEGASQQVFMSLDFTTSGVATFTSTPSMFSSIGLNATSPGFLPAVQIGALADGSGFGTCFTSIQAVVFTASAATATFSATASPTFTSVPGPVFSCGFTGPVTQSITVVAQLETVPEPASLTLLGLGLAGLAVRLRKRQGA